MKNYFLAALFFILMPMVLFAEPNPKPEKIYSIVRALYPLDYYLEQAELWKQEIEKDKKNADAWFNYYNAGWMINRISDGDKENIFDLDDILAQVTQAIPDTYEYNYLVFRNAKGSEDYFSYLQKAYEIDPNRWESYPGLIGHYERKRDKEKVKFFIQKWFDSGEYSSGILAWNYNALMSLEENAMLITFADNDTYPVWMLQLVKGVRQDVSVINAYLLTDENYRQKVFSEFGIKPFLQKEEDFIEWEDYYFAIMEHLIQDSKRPSYLGVSLPKSMMDKHSENLYLVGLAFKFSKKEFDNVAVLKNNYEHKFLKDYLKINLEHDISLTVLNQMNLNYIPPFMLLHQHYLTGGETAKAAEVEMLSLKIAKAGGRENQVLKYLNGEDSLGSRGDLVSIIPIKSLEKGKVKINNNFYASETELTNKEYDLFLIDLVKNREFEALEKCKIGETDWRAFLPKQYKDISDEKLFIHGKPTDETTPVQNISYEAAILYCEWMTNVYNNSNSKKKKFNKVLFRLPTEKEWELAALAGKENVPYPWGGHYFTNVKGCYLSNAYVTEEDPHKKCPSENKDSKDGGFFMVKADAYFPNDFGLYGMTGNLAEMVQEEGIAKGGSWEDVPKDCQITSVKKYDGPSPAIGFRVFIEILD